MFTERLPYEEEKNATEVYNLPENSMFADT